MTHNTHSSFRMTKALAAITIITLAVIIYFATLQRQTNYDSTVEAAKEASAKIVRTISENAELGLHTVEQTLRRAADRQYFNALFGGNLKSDMDHNLRLWTQDAPHIEALFMTDEKGTIHTIHSVHSDDIITFEAGDNLSLHPHFVKHRTMPEQEILLSPYSTNPNNHYILMSHRLEKLDGNFGGLVIGVVDGRFITRLFKSAELNNHSQIAVFFDNDTLLVDDFGFYKTPDFLSTLADIAPHTNHTNIHSRYINDKLHVITSRSLQHFPIHITMVHHEGGFLSSWHHSQRNAYIFLSILLILGAATLTFIFITAWQLKHAHSSKDAAVNANRTTSDFLAKMSHELRTPLNAIIGFSRMLKNGSYGSVNEDQMQRLSDINGCATHLLDLINDILIFSKGEAQKMSLVESHVDTAAIVNSAINIVSERAHKKHVRLINNAASNMPYLHGDERKLKQIIINLLTNAVKFSLVNGTVTIRTALDKRRNFILQIEDNGLGLSKDDIPKALSVFGQVHGDSKLEGTGLGLPICQMFAQLHDGSLHIDSAVGKGTTVTVTIPSTRVAVDHPAELSKRSA